MNLKIIKLNSGESLGDLLHGYCWKAGGGEEVLKRVVVKAMVMILKRNASGDY